MVVGDLALTTEAVREYIQLTSVVTVGTVLALLSHSMAASVSPNFK